MKKMEHRTSLSGGVMVNKTDPRVELRGRLDSLSAGVVRLQTLARTEGLASLVEELEEALAKIYDALLCEATGKPCASLTLWGMTADEIRERSHHPARWLGLDHIRPHYTMGAAAAGINALRTQTRETELAACRAFETPEGCARADIVEFLNRLSSAFYVLTYKYLPEGYDKTVRAASA
jgi:ethanolamine utilization cobalamin adenosyltransferase